MASAINNIPAGAGVANTTPVGTNNTTPAGTNATDQHSSRHHQRNCSSDDLQNHENTLVSI